MIGGLHTHLCWTQTPISKTNVLYFEPFSASHLFYFYTLILLLFKIASDLNTPVLGAEWDPNKGELRSVVSARTLLEHQFAPVVWRVAADVLLNVGVLVVVDPHALVPSCCSQPVDQTGLPHRRLSLDQHWVNPVRPNRSERVTGGQTIDYYQLNVERCCNTGGPKQPGEEGPRVQRAENNCCHHLRVTRDWGPNWAKEGLAFALESWTRLTNVVFIFVTLFEFNLSVWLNCHLKASLNKHIHMYSLLLYHQYAAISWLFRDNTCRIWSCVVYGTIIPNKEPILWYKIISNYKMFKSGTLFSKLLVAILYNNYRNHWSNDN